MSSQTLGNKEQSLFQQVVKHYENKQHKKGIKVADQLLRKVPDHGNTLAMKALILNSTGQKDEAFALGKEALKHDMKSHVCWHVYGLLYKDARNFEESSKAYRMALRIKPDSVEIQRDLAHLQIQIRDYAGYLQSRRAMLKARPTIRANWTALAIAQHVEGNLEDAEKTLSIYEDSLKSTPPKTDTEHQQAILYKNTIIAETGNYERALEHLNATTKHVYDKQVVMELRAEYNLKLKQYAEAEQYYRVLLNRNPDNRAYYAGLLAALQLDQAEPQKQHEFYRQISEKYPKADSPRRLPLDILTQDDFRKAADDYLRSMLRKGVPSTFANIKALYQSKEKQQIIEDLVLSYSKEATTTNGSDAKATEETDRFRESTSYFLAQHYNYHTSRNLSKALKYIDDLIEKAPKTVDYSMTKARILKNQGNTKAAAEMMDHARSLDERDRHINTKSAKYQLRNNNHEKAIDIMGKFTKPDAPGGPLGDLIEMQCVWFLTEDGESYLRKRKLGLALKRFHSIWNIFEIWQEDQFDFHSFSLRKGQIRAYVDLIRWEDQLYAHPFFTRTAVAVCKAYILLHDQPELAKEKGLTNGDAADAKAKKKAAQKAKKEQEKLDAEADKKTTKSTKVDLDPEGKLLLDTKDPLKDAMKFLTAMLESSPKSIQAQEVGFEVFLRRKKYLLALKCLLATKELSSPDSPHVHSQVLRLQHALQNLETPLDPKIAQIFDQESKSFSPPSDVKAANEAFLAEHSDSASVLAGAHVRQVYDREVNRTQAPKDFATMIEHEETSLRLAQAALDLLKHWSAKTDVYIAAAHKRWPEATVFEVDSS